VVGLHILNSVPVLSLVKTILAADRRGGR
jgi:hypothetical protein